MMFQSSTGFNPFSDIQPYTLHSSQQTSQPQGFFQEQNGAQATPLGQVHHIPTNHVHSSTPITDYTATQASSVGYQTFQDKQSSTSQYQQRLCYTARTEHWNQEHSNGGVQYSRFANEGSWKKDYSGNTDNIVPRTSRFGQAGQYQTQLNTLGNLPGMEGLTNNNCNNSLMQRQTTTHLPGAPGNPPSMEDYTNNRQINLAKSQTAPNLPRKHYMINANSYAEPTTISNGGQRHVIQATRTQASISRNPTPQTPSSSFVFTGPNGQSYIVTCNKVDNCTATSSTRINGSRPPLREAHFVTNNPQPQHVTPNSSSTLRLGTASVIANTNIHNVDHPLIRRSVIRSVPNLTSTDAREIGLQPVATSSARTAPQEQANNKTRVTAVPTEAVFKVPVPVKAPQSSVANRRNSETCVSHTKKPAISQDFWEFINSPQVSHNFADDEDEDQVKFWVPDPEIWKQEQDCRRRSSDKALKNQRSHLVKSTELFSHDRARIVEMSTLTRSFTSDLSHHGNNLVTDHSSIPYDMTDVSSGTASSDKNKLPSLAKSELVRNFEKEPNLINNAATQKTAEQKSPSFEAATSLMPLHSVDVVGLESANRETLASPDSRLAKDDYEKEDVPVILNVFSLKNQEVGKSIPEETNQSPQETVNWDDSDDSFALYICDEDSSSPTKRTESDARPHDKHSDNAGKEIVTEVYGSAKLQNCSIDELQKTKEDVVEDPTLATKHTDYLFEKTIQKAKEGLARETNLKDVIQIQHPTKVDESPTFYICNEDSRPPEENKESSTSTPAKLINDVRIRKTNGASTADKVEETVNAVPNDTPAQKKKMLVTSVGVAKNKSLSKTIEKVAQSLLREKNSPNITKTANVLCSRKYKNFAVSSVEKKKSQFRQKGRDETPSMVERLAKIKKKYRNQKLSRIKFLADLPISGTISNSRTLNRIDNEKRENANGMFKGESSQILHKHKRKGSTPLRKCVRKVVIPTLNTATRVNNENMGRKENISVSVRAHETVNNGIPDIAQRKTVPQERLKAWLVNVSDISEDDDSISQERQTFESYKSACQNHIPVPKSFPEQAAASVTVCATKVNTSTPDNSNKKTCFGNLIDRPNNRSTEDSNERTLLFSILELKNTAEIRRGSIETENSWPFLHPDNDSVLEVSDDEELDSGLGPLMKRLRIRSLSSEDHDWPKFDGDDFHKAPNKENATCSKTNTYPTTKPTSKNSLDFSRKRKISENGYAKNALVPTKIKIYHSNEKDPVALELKKSVMPKHSVQLSCETFSQDANTCRQTDSKLSQALETEESHTAKILVLGTKESAVESSLQRKISSPTTVNLLHANSTDSKLHSLKTRQSSDRARMGNWRVKEFSDSSLKLSRCHVAEKPVVSVSREDRSRNVFLAMQKLIKIGVVTDTESNTTSESEKRESPLPEDGSICLESESTREEPESRKSTSDGVQSAERGCNQLFIGGPMCYKEEDLIRQIEANNARKRESDNQNYMPHTITSNLQQPAISNQQQPAISNLRLIPEEETEQEFAQALQYKLKGVYRSPNGENVRWYTREEFTSIPCAVKIRKLNIKGKTIKVHRNR